MALKVDIKKAYDSVSWEFLLKALKGYGFSDLWFKWISSILHSTRYSILLNGTPTGFFQPARGLRQGCPLSPLLSTLVTDQISQKINEAVQRKEITVMHSTRRLQSPLCHLFFADDLMVACQASISNAKALALICKNFEEISGLQMNPQKSKVLFSRAARRKQGILRLLQCSEEVFPIKYLGLPLCPSGLKRSNCKELIDKIINKISHWNTKLLSLAGDSDCWIWKPNSQGRFDVRSFFRSLTAEPGGSFPWKSVWRSKAPLKVAFFAWTSILGKILTQDNLRRRNQVVVNRCSDSVIWKSIVETRETMLLNVSYQVGSGQEFNFFLDPWCEGLTIAQKFGHRMARRLPFHRDAKLYNVMLNGDWNLALVQEDFFQAFRDFLNKLPTMLNLQKRRLPLVSRCSLCLQALDTMDHLFVTCDMGNFAETSKVLCSLFAASLWAIWKERNARLHLDVCTISSSVARQILFEVLTVQHASLQDLIC
ncbi:uncharacterized protein LOC132281113 [Cornus florida]|uniref:uncharacterized protein LOC132281113 n=1 Tax=Cornus florida TaxID=4283 RepID=UPI002899DAC7|nr:uncharacterized protein LOC132281113 [Cornus florida]